MSKSLIAKVCPHCGARFDVVPSYRLQRFCSKSCGSKHSWAAKRKHRERVCQQCGRDFMAPRWNHDQKFCSRQCFGRYNSGPQNPFYKDGSDPYPSRRVGGVPVADHRRVMSEHIGRALRPKEVVHHINGDTRDNRIENLRLFRNHSEHRTDHIEKAREAGTYPFGRS